MPQTRRQFLGSAAGLAAATASAAPERKWNLLIITNDQHRADCLGCYGNKVIRTPAADRLASEGVRCENYFVHAPQCVPSRASLHTGRYPHVHRVPTNAYRLPDSEQTIAKILNAQGYRTACVGEMPFAPRSYTGGFERVLASNKDYDKFLAQHGLKFPAAEGPFQAAPVPWTDDMDETAFFANHARGFLHVRSRGEDALYHAGSGEIPGRRSGERAGGRSGRPADDSGRAGCSDTFGCAGKIVSAAGEESNEIGSVELSRSMAP